MLHFSIIWFSASYPGLLREFIPGYVYCKGSNSKLHWLLGFGEAALGR